MENLKVNIGNRCLGLADSLLKDDALTKETVELVGKLVDVALALDRSELRWEEFKKILF